MTDEIFATITCPQCLRTSAVGLSLIDLRDELDTDRPIRLRCGFDGNTWDAGARERARLAKLCREYDVVARGNLFRKRPDLLRYGA
jgi:hypothetical protein